MTDEERDAILECSHELYLESRYLRGLDSVNERKAGDKDRFPADDEQEESKPATTVAQQPKR